MKVETTPIPGLEDAAAWLEKNRERNQAYAALVKSILPEHEYPYTYEYPFVRLEHGPDALWHIYHEWKEMPRSSEVALETVMDDHVFAHCGEHVAEWGCESDSEEFTFSCTPPPVEQLCRACLGAWWSVG